MKAPTKLPTRLLAGLLLAWLSIATIEPLGLHSCPMHGGLSMSGEHSGHSMAHHGSGMPARNSHPNHCSCPGDCAGPSTSIAVIPDVIGYSAGVLSPRAAVRGRPASSDARYTPRLLPFANAPPELS